ncbi:MAG TPA: TlpA disulfide reductase family protein [Usitatibacter sp.]|jgi:thiol-disulfide isomerase/thioredoxin|nr:TlpA disulfide reductase family protein [Usitatibacter sp.]
MPSRSELRRAWLRRALALCAAGAAGGLPLVARAHHLVLGRPAPPLVLHTLDGKEISTPSLVGKVVIATFWATWCVPCREELPLLSDYAAAHAKDGLQVLGFSLDGPDKLAAVKRVADTLSFPVGLLGSNYAGDYGRIWRLPVNFTIDRAGHLVDNGWDDDDPVWTKERLERVVSPLLSRSG